MPLTHGVILCDLEGGNGSDGKVMSGSVRDDRDDNQNVHSYEWSG